MKKVLLFLLVVAFLPLTLAACKKQQVSNSGAKSGQESRKAEGYAGNVISGNISPYIEFNKADYDKALSEGKIIFLDFYATWCPICRAEAPNIEAGFNELENGSVIGFRVNYNDPETDDDEKALAKQFGVTYQHTKVIIRDGQQVLKDGESWTREMFTEEINKVI